MPYKFTYHKKTISVNCNFENIPYTTKIRVISAEMADNFNKKYVSNDNKASMKMILL